MFLRNSVLESFSSKTILKEDTVTQLKALRILKRESFCEIEILSKRCRKEPKNHRELHHLNKGAKMIGNTIWMFWLF